MKYRLKCNFMVGRECNFIWGSEEQNRKTTGSPTNANLVLSLLLMTTNLSKKEDRIQLFAWLPYFLREALQLMLLLNISSGSVCHRPFLFIFFRNISKNAKKLKFLGPSQHPQFFYLVSYFYFFPRVGTGPGAALQWVPPAPRVAAGTGPQGRGEAGGAALQPKVVQE